MVIPKEVGRQTGLSQSETQVRKHFSKEGFGLRNRYFSDIQAISTLKTSPLAFLTALY